MTTTDASTAKDAEDWVPVALPIPKRWSYVDFEDALAAISTSKIKIPQKDYLTEGLYPVIDQGQSFVGGYTDSDSNLVDEDRAMIVFGDHTKCFKFAPFPFAPGADGTKVLRPSEFLDEKFAYYACLSLRLPDRGYSRHYSFLKRSQFPVAPINEQGRIVARIEELFSELDKGMENLQTAREQLKVYRQALLKHAFEGKLTAQWRQDNKDKLETSEQLLERIKKERQARHQEQVEEWEAAVRAWEGKDKPGKKPTKPRTPKPIDKLSRDEIEELPELPLGWCWEKLGWLTTGVEYGTAAKSSKSAKMPVLRMGNIQNAKIDWSDLVYTSDEAEIEQYALKPGDVLFNRTNSPELVGKTAVYRGTQPALFAGYLIRINQIETIAESQYLNLFLNSHVAKKHGNSVKTDGVNQSNINGTKLQNYPFPYCTLDEQREIVRLLDEKLSIVDQLERDVDDELRKSDTLRQSILKKALSGQLVAQDPNDEPASVLLERIKTEKADRENANKNNKRKDAA